MIYEFPLNESVRRLLRVEMLCQQAESHILLDSPYSSLAAIESLVDIIEIVSKNNLKLEMVKQLDHLQYSEQLSLEQQKDIKEQIKSLVSQSTRVFDELKESIFLNVLRQRLGVMAGLCSFDLPSLHHWLRLPHEVRKQHFDQWFSILATTKEAIHFILSLIRSIKIIETSSFKRGFYYQAIKWNACLVRIDMDEYDMYPEFSGNKHQLSIRLISQLSPWDIATQIEDDLSLDLEICGS